VFLNRICANYAPRKPQGISLVHLLSNNGRILSEMTLSRIGAQHFFALSAAAAELRDEDLLRQRLLPGEQVRIDNVTDARGVLVLSGPRSRELLQSLTPADMSHSGFPYLRAYEITVAGLPVLALRVSYVGELGWELHAPMAAIEPLYAALFARGREFGIAHYGLYAVNSMRIEKAYKAWGSELTNELTLLEADMARFIQFDKADFVGKEAARKKPPGAYKIVYLEVAAQDADVRGGEPILRGAECIGVATSGAYGHRVGKSLAFAAVAPQFAAPGTEFDLLIQGERRQARVLERAAFDPDNHRMKH
jgi:dimethylglycine dehydrogenase